MVEGGLSDKSVVGKQVVGKPAMAKEWENWEHKGQGWAGGKLFFIDQRDEGLVRNDWS